MQLSQNCYFYLLRDSKTNMKESGFHCGIPMNLIWYQGITGTQPFKKKKEREREEFGFVQSEDLCPWLLIDNLWALGDLGTLRHIG